MSKYLEFKKAGFASEKRITVLSKKQKSPLGEIVFYQLWKQYIFEPISNAIFNDECLMDISSYITILNKEKS